MTEPGGRGGAPEAEAGQTKGWLDHVVLALGPLLLVAFAVWVVVVLRADSSWGEVAAVVLGSAVVGAVLSRTLAGLRVAVPAFALGLLVGLVLFGAVLDRDTWIGLFTVGFIGGALLVPQDKARREARRRA